MNEFLILWDNGREELIMASKLSTGRRYLIGKGWCFVEQLKSIKYVN